MLEQVEDSGSASVVSQLEVWRGQRSGRIVGALGRGLTCMGGAGQKASYSSSPRHSPQLVRVDVDPCRQTAAASDKAQEAAPVLWMEKEISARTYSLILYPTSGVKSRYYSALYH